MKLSERYPDLNLLTAGSSFSQLFNLLYTASLLRYTTKEHLNQINHKLGTPRKLQILAESGYLTCKNSKVFVITDKTRRLLEEQGYTCKILAKKITGETAEHELLIASVILDMMKDDNFYSVFYPTFMEPPNYDRDFLKPDACVIFKKERQYKISFLEVENEKPGWEAYLQAKQEKYETIGRDYNTYGKWWKFWSEKLRLPYCNQDSFCFSVLCTGDIERNWEGWMWRKRA